MAPGLDVAFGREVSKRQWSFVGGALVLLLFAFAVLYETGALLSPSGSLFGGERTNGWGQQTPPPRWTFDSQRDQRNLGLDDGQCDAAFPGLYAELERARDFHAARGGINISQIAIWVNEPGTTHAQTRVLLYNGNLHIVGDKRGYARRERVGAALSNLLRAINAVPDPRLLPNIEFTIDTLDDPNPRSRRRPGRTVWGWDRHVTDEETWVMPDFGGWSYVGGTLHGGLMGYNNFRDEVEEVERHLERDAAEKGEESTWEVKTPKALWRGTVGLANSDVPHTRQELLKAADKKDWSDIKGEHFVRQVDHCRWQYLVHTEGYAWGGRLRYLMNCNSAVIIPWPLHFIAHFYPLLQPDGPHQNFIPVKPDWSDLDETIQIALDSDNGTLSKDAAYASQAGGSSSQRPKPAKEIAASSSDVFRDRYLTPAAEACYLRRMIKLYAEVQNFTPQLWKEVLDEEGKKAKVPRGYDWEYFSYKEPCQRPPDPNVDRSKVDFEE